MSMRHCLALLFLVAANCFGQSDISTLLSKANHGDSQAQLLIAKAYEKGDGVPQSDELAVQWYTKAAQNGNPDAQNALGVMYSTGHGVGRDKEAAIRWYRTAAKQGSAVAAFNLGAAYYNGDGVPVDDAASFGWFLIAKQGGSEPAAAAIEREVTQDVGKSLVGKGELQAAALCEAGTEVPQNLSLAMKFYGDASKMEITLLPFIWVTSSPRVRASAATMNRPLLGTARLLTKKIRLDFF